MHQHINCHQTDTTGLKIQKPIKAQKTVEKQQNVDSISTFLISGNATDTITSNVQKQDVTKLSIKCETGMPTTAWFIKTD